MHCIPWLTAKYSWRIFPSFLGSGGWWKVPVPGQMFWTAKLQELVERVISNQGWPWREQSTTVTTVGGRVQPEAGWVARMWLGMDEEQGNRGKGSRKREEGQERLSKEGRSWVGIGLRKGRKIGKGEQDRDVTQRLKSTRPHHFWHYNSDKDTERGTEAVDGSWWRREQGRGLGNMFRLRPTALVPLGVYNMNVYVCTCALACVPPMSIGGCVSVC